MGMGNKKEKKRRIKETKISEIYRYRSNRMMEMKRTTLGGIEWKGRAGESERIEQTKERNDKNTVM